MSTARCAAAILALGLLASCGGKPPQRAAAQPEASPVTTPNTPPATTWRTPLPGIVRCDQGTIEITARCDRPMREFGNGWDFLLQVLPGKVIGKGANTLLGVFIPPAPDSGLVALIRTGTKTIRVQAKDWVCTPGKPVNLAVSWGRRLTLWCDGTALASAEMSESPAEILWPADVAIERFAPFDPAGIRIASCERDAQTIDADPLSPFTADADTTLVAGADLQARPLPASRWQRESGYAVAKPVWLPEEQCLTPDDAAGFPMMVANHGAVTRTARLELVLTPLAGSEPIAVARDLPIRAGTPATPLRVELPALASDWYAVAWKVAGDGLPTLDGTSSLAVYPRDRTPAEGALAGFYAVHRPDTWSTAPFQRMGVRATRAWAHSSVFMWFSLEPTPGRFRWEQADAYVDSCLAGGQEILAVLGYPSRWASAEPSAEHKGRHDLAQLPCRWQPADLQAWARYVRATAERYKGRVRHYEVYNEVNFCPPGLPATFSGGVAEYLALQRIAYQEIKAVDPQAMVTSSGFSADVNKAMPTAALAGGLAQWCDIFNVHGYSGVEGTNEWVAEWRRQRPDAPVWQTEQMWFQLDDERRRWWLTAALPIQYAADGYQRFYNMGISEVFFTRSTWSPTRDQWVVAVMNNELRPCTSFSGLLGGAGKGLDMHHRFARSDGSVLSVLGSERGPMAVTLSARPQRVRDLFGRPLATTPAASGVSLLIPDLAWVVSDAPLEVLSAEPVGDAPMLVNGGFEQIDGDVGMGGLAAGKARGFTLRDTTYDPAGSVRLSDRPHGGTYAIELATSGKGRVYLFQNVQLPAAGTFELGGWFRADRGAPEPYLFAYDQDSGKIHEAKLTGSGDGFRHLTLELAMPARNVKPLAVGWGIRGTGAATLDDVSFAPLAPRFDHARFAALDLTPAANLGLGGWAAVLPGMGRDDLSRLATGERVLAGRSFRIAGGDKALIALGDADHPALPKRAEIAIGGKVAGLAFLHTALFAKAKAGESVGSYLVTYADGTTVRHPIIHQRSIADWFKPVADPVVPVADTIDMPDRIARCLYTDRWTNPSPDKEIRSLTIEATGGAVLIVAAISQEKP